LSLFLFLLIVLALFVGLVVHVHTSIELSSFSPLGLENFLEERES
jgi:hypothetical protein